jgi:hypothetical protein
MVFVPKDGSDHISFHPLLRELFELVYLTKEVFSCPLDSFCFGNVEGIPIYLEGL